MLTPCERFIALVDNDPLHFADAIVVLEGDGLHRAAYGADLYNSGLAEFILISGGRDDPKAGAIPANLMCEHAKQLGVPSEDIGFELHSMNTREQAVETVEWVNKVKNTKILLVASHYHQYRAYLTFLKAMQEQGREFWIINAPARDIPWYPERIELLNDEFDKIEKYRELGHIAGFDFAIEYQRRKEEALR